MSYYEHEFTYELDEFCPGLPGVGTLSCYFYGSVKVDFNNTEDWQISEIKLMREKADDWSLPRVHPLFEFLETALCNDRHFLEKIDEEYESATEDDPDARREFIRDMREYERRYC